MGLSRRSAGLDPRTLPPVAARPSPAAWLADFEWVEQQLDLPSKLRLWELLDAETAPRVYSTPPEWEHRLQLDCLRVRQWLRRQQDRSAGQPLRLRCDVSSSPYWQAVVHWVAERLQLPVDPVTNGGQPLTPPRSAS